MIYTIPTKQGLGIELWGTFNDLKCLYEVIGKLWNNEDYENIKGFQSRDSTINAFSYEIRKAYQEDRQKRERNHFTLETEKYLGTKLSWVHILFSLSAIRFNMRFIEPNKFDLSMIMCLEFWLEKSMIQYDPEGAVRLIPFINAGIYAGNEYLYQYLRSINAQYFRLGGGKRVFRELPDLLNQAILFSKEYKNYLEFLILEAKGLNCEISHLETNDSDIDYENIKW